jgi:hypothetical protein
LHRDDDNHETTDARVAALRRDAGAPWQPPPSRAAIAQRGGTNALVRVDGVDDDDEEEEEEEAAAAAAAAAADVAGEAGGARRRRRLFCVGGMNSDPSSDGPPRFLSDVSEIYGLDNDVR